MLPSKNRLQAKQKILNPRSVALSSEPVLHKNKEGDKTSNKQQAAKEQTSTATTTTSKLITAAPAPFSWTAVSSEPAASSVASAAATSASTTATTGEQYTYVTDESGYTWLYDTIYGQYYYYDAAQGTYIPYGQPVTTAAAATGSEQSNANDNDNGNGDGKEGKDGKSNKKRRIVRMAGGQVWEDATLDKWPTDDYRLFAGDLGPEMTSEMLQQVFGKFESLQRTHVVRDKKTDKSRGYGFLSFGNADDFLKAWREFNGKYVGSRPITLRKSNWKDRNADIRKVKRQDKRAFLEFKHKKK
ncbi:hypothetical protein BX661DRAFT_175205 [Kickxella alabastrina]|uniref:uncharacterized protein n=1 Tax=Kickxella alabastrina TaxID=61397 RepID=UPI0022206EBB|nr:uncharacterized protein BX661DRAFT_175205 [Kickxella alabastrina]KAI7834617.1 hypothetical protein BX661DRAFT_175205 [Kickxella alabastrina]KAJ1935176.1 hypothetical protein GGF37_006093 [Kickxella alabastrina]